MEDKLDFTLSHRECLMVISGMGVIIDMFHQSPEWARGLVNEMTLMMGDNPQDPALFERQYGFSAAYDVWDGAMTALALLRAMMEAEIERGMEQDAAAWFDREQVDQLGGRLSDALTPYLEAQRAEAE